MIDYQIGIEEQKEKVLAFINDENYKPMKIKQMMVILDIPSEQRTLLKQILKELLEEQKIVKTKKGKYALPGNYNLYYGTYEGNQNGYGFIIREGSDVKDIFVAKKYTNGAMHKDTVMYKLTKPEKPGKHAEAEIVKIIKRGTIQIVGTYQQCKNFGFVIADDSKHSRDIYIPKKKTKHAITGNKVVVKITKYPEEDKNPEGEVVEILGHINEPTTEILAIVRQYDIPTEFPSEVKAFIENIPSEVSEKDKKNREDLRDVKMVTIDGEDAKDLDDAVSLRKLDNGNYELGVHIADVSQYVTENSPLDKEAIKRGTSVYLTNTVIPMLPRKLSNGICSLNEKVDRLALSCIMEIDNKGIVLGHRIAETLINIDRRMTYTDVKKVLEDEDPETIKKHEDFVEFFKLMKELSLILREKRFNRGSIDFNFEESKIVLDNESNPIEIKPYDRNIATRIIEEFMLITNETIAEDYFWQDVPFVYRSHEEPDGERIQHLSEFVHNFGYNMRKGNGAIHPKTLQQVLDQVEGKDEEGIISRLVLRSMKRAQYTSTADGHFGLAAKYYCHFTSPIRRYPDLQIHRIIKQNLRGKMSTKKYNSLKKLMPEIAKQCSVTERRADDAERDTDKYMKVKYMSNKIGETFDGVISSITNWGMYIELPNTVEGLVHVSNMFDDYYNYDEKLHVFVGEKTKNVYRLGDRVTVKLIATDQLRRTIDFVIVPNEDMENDKADKEKLNSEEIIKAEKPIEP